MESPYVRLDVVINQLQKISDNVKHMGFGGKPLDEVTDENIKSLIKHHKVVLADYYLSDLRVKEECILLFVRWALQKAVHLDPI